MSPEERFWARVEKSDGCWEWQGHRNAGGYGIYRYRQTDKAHRASWMIHNGEIVDDLHVLHRCDNPPCVRPDHLFLGTHLDNVADRVAKDRSKSEHGEHPEKLTWESAERIRQLVAEGQYPWLVAAYFGVSRVMVSKIVRGDSWNPQNRRTDA